MRLSGQYNYGLLVTLQMSTTAGYKILAAFAVFLLAGYAVLDHWAPAGRRLAKIRGEDPVAYFGIAHSVLFDHDFNLTNEFEHVPPAGRLWTADQKETGLPGSPWGLGYSFLEVPLLGLGTAIDLLAGNPADGFSEWAIYFYCYGTVLMAALGLFALFTFLREVASFYGDPLEDRTVPYGLLATFAVFFGTNVGFYAFSQMSHSSTFLVASLFLAFWWRVKLSEDARQWLILGLLGGFLTICRWQDLVYLAGPGLFDLFGWDLLKKGWPWWRSRLLFVAGVIICWIPQFMEFKAIYGHYFTIPHGSGIFSFPPPHMLQVVLSTESGWFTWTPLTLLGVVGLFIGSRKAPRVYLPWIAVIVLEVAVAGSVPFWSGLGSFSARYLLSTTPLIGMGVVTFFCAASVPMRRALLAACLACCLYTGVFAIQFRLDLVPTGVPLTFTELIVDKFRLPQVRQRKAALVEAREHFQKGDLDAAIRILQSTERFGEDRDVDAALGQAYRAAGKPELADAIEMRRMKFVGPGM